jgi:hypothetical protein
LLGKSNISIEEQTNKEPLETLKPSLEVLVNEYSDGFKALAQHEEKLVAVTQSVFKKRNGNTI